MGGDSWAKEKIVIDQMVSVLKAACDRAWSNETPIQVANIAANAIYWRDREIEMLRAEIGSGTQVGGEASGIVGQERSAKNKSYKSPRSLLTGPL